MSDVTICNSALAKIGYEPFIVGLDENSKAARYCSVIYPEARDKLQRENIWRFTIKRSTLAPNVTLPDSDGGKYFTIPDDCLRIIGTSADMAAMYLPWRREGNAIKASDTDALEIVYCSRVTDTNLFDVSYSDLLSTYIGFELCQGLTRDAGLKQQMYQLYEKQSRKAAFLSATERDPQKILSEIFLGAR